MGSFVKHMPWDSVAVDVKEAKYEPEGRIFAFKKPDGKLTIVLSNRSQQERKFDIDTGLAAGTVWDGVRYTPDDAGKDTMGVPNGTSTGQRLAPTLAPQSWQFWMQR